MFSTLVKFFTGAAEHARLDPELVRSAGDRAARHRFYHRWIIVIAIGTGVAVGTIGTRLLLTESTRKGTAMTFRDGRMLLMAPLLFGAVGMLLGATAAATFAPRAFLTGPIGARWLRLTGVKSVWAARLVYAVIALVLAAFVAFPVVAQILEERGILPPPSHW